jgi:hypothetical protein
MLTGNRRMLGLIAMIGALTALGLPTQALAQSATDLAPFKLKVNGRGQGDILAMIEDAVPGEEDPCTDVCLAHYRPGRVVTLTARPKSPFEFGFWSDDRCPPGPVCKLVVDRGAQTVVATFSPQLLIVEVSNDSSGPAQLTSEPAVDPPVPAPFPSCGRVEVPIGASRQVWCRAFPASRDKQIKLNAVGDKPFWGAGLKGDACDAPDGASCSLVAHSRRQVALRFGGPPLLLPGDPGDLKVTFRIAKEGTGSGTVRSTLLDCGDTCNATLNFGELHALTADANPGSRFVRWRGACTTNPQCALAVGPVTRVTAVFDAVETASETQPSGGRPQQSKRTPSSQAAFVARVGPVIVPGGRPRRIHFTVRVNARSSIRAVLHDARGRRVSSHTWSIQSGKHVLRLRVPKRARRGTYVLKITAHDTAGNVKRFKRRVQLRR